MKAYKINSNLLQGDLITHAEFVNGVFKICELAPAVTDFDIALVTDNQKLLDGAVYEILCRGEVNIGAAASGKPEHTVIAVHGTAPNKPLVAGQDVFAKTVSGRTKMHEYASASGKVLAHVHMPFPDDASEFALTIPESIGGTLIIGSGIELQAAEFQSFEQAAASLQPSLALGPHTRSGDLVTVPVTLLRGDGTPSQRSATVFIEPTCGVAITSRVELVNGTGQAVVSLAGVPAGTLGRIKAGFRYYPGKAETSFEA